MKSFRGQIAAAPVSFSQTVLAILSVIILSLAALTVISAILLSVTASVKAAALPKLPTIDKQSALGVRGDVERAMWVWSSEDIVYSVGTSKADFFDFCENPKGIGDAAAPAFSQRSINHLFFDAHGFVISGQEEMDSLRSFLREAHTRGIRVDYLDGEAAWINRGAGEANQIVNSVLAFNKSGQPEERFDGFMLDVQPYTLRGWYTPALWNQYLTFLRTMNVKIHASDKNLQFGASIPRWYDATLGSQALVDVYSNVNYVTVLDYVNDERALVESISNEIQIADSMNVRVFAGVETASSVLSNVTFQNSGWLAMEQSLASVNESYMFNKSFAGVAISGYASYRAMPRAAHSLDVAASMSAQVGNSVAELMHANADVLVLDGAFAQASSLQKKDVHSLQNSMGRSRTVLAGVSIAKFMKVGPHPGAESPLLVGDNGPTAQMKSTVARLLALGFDGFSIDLDPAVQRAQKLNDPAMEQQIVNVVHDLGILARESCKRTNSVIVVRGGESLLGDIDAASYRTFSSTVDGIVPTIAAPPATALLSAFDRDRFFIYATLQELAQSGVRVFGDYNVLGSIGYAAASGPVQQSAVMAEADIH